VLVLSIPAVQTHLGKKATKRINDDFGTNINIGKIGLQFNGDVELKEIYIEDYKKDTLINIAELNTSILSFKNLYNGKLIFGDIDVMDLTLNIKTYSGEKDTNLDIFVARFDDDNPRKEKSGFILSSSDVSIYDSKFRLIDYNKEHENILVFDDLNINATNFLIKGPDVNARINTLAFVDSRGLNVSNMTTDFEYTLTHMNFKNLNIKTPGSHLSGNVRFDYSREDLQDFEDKVKVTANFKDSDVLLDELNILYNEFGKDQRAILNTDLTGTLNNLQATNLNISTSRNTRIIGDIKFENLFNSADNKFSLDGNFRKLSSNYYDLKALLPNILGESIPSVFSKLGNFNIKGSSYITSSTIEADVDMSTELGVLSSNLKMNHIDDIDNASYKGNVVFDNFDLGQLLNDPKLKTTSFNLDVDGKGFTIDNLSTEVKGEVYAINYNEYNYEDIEISGTLGNNIFNGALNSNDKNLKLNFDGLIDYSREKDNAYNFTANVEYANLKALNFISRDSISEFKGNVKINMKGHNVDDAFGTITFKNTSYKNQNSNYYFKDFAIASNFIDDIREIIVNSPDIIEGRLEGEFKFKDVTKLLENALGSIYTNYKPFEIEANQFIDFEFKIYNKIAEVFLPELELGSNTSIKGRVESDAKGFRLTFNTPQIKYTDYFANNIKLTVDNSNPLFNTYVQIDSINTNYYSASNFNLINVTIRDTLFIKTEFKGGKKNHDEFKLNMFYTINADNKSVVGFRKSDVKLKDNDWLINEDKNNLNKIIFDRSLETFSIDHLIMSHDEEELELSGLISPDNKQINLDFRDVDLVKITPSIDSLSLEGNINGKLEFVQKNGIYLPTSDISINDFKANGYELGNLMAKINGNQSLTSYNINVLLENDNLKSLEAIGNIDVSKTNSYIDLDVNFDEFLLNPLNPFGEGVITNIRGIVSGNAIVRGDLKKPQIEGKLLLDNAGITIPYLNVDYSFDFDSEVQLKGQQFIFNNAVLTDSEYFSKATLNGFIGHNNFSDWSLGLTVDTNRFLVLNTDDNEEALYYGTAFVNGEAKITGPTDQLVIAVDGSTAKGTSFTVPLNDFESYGDNTYIHFLTPEEKEARVNGDRINENEINGLELQFDLIVNPLAEIEIVIDRNSGSTIKGAGNGNLLFQINTNGKFDMWGDFSVTRGTYNFAYGGLIQKDFEVEPGGKIEWEGDPLKAQINLKAIYKTEANPSVLLDNPINRSIPIEVGINLSGQLEQPEPDFSFEFPNVSSTIKSELDYRLESKESRENQALYLLATGSFASELSLGQQAYGTIADRVNGFFNSLIANDNDKLQFGVNYQVGEQTPDYQTDDRLGLTLKTKISDRVLINGKVGVPIGGVNETVIAGDVQIDILLNEEGTLTAKVFNRENSIRNFGEEIGYTQGVGLSYNVEFDTFKELIRIIFTGKNKKKMETVEKENDSLQKTKDDNFPDFINVKEKTDTKGQ